MGDVLMTTPALRALKASLPGRRITLLASNSGAEIANFITEVDHVIRYQAPWMKSSTARGAALDHNMIALLAREGFDAAVIFTVYSQNPLPAALLCHLSGIPLRLAHCRENPYQLLTDWIPDSEPTTHVRHEVRRQLDLVAAVDCYTGDERLSCNVPAADIEWAKLHLYKANINSSKPWIVVHPGASAPSRRYPSELWIEALKKLSLSLKCPMVFTGTSDEMPLIESIRSELPSDTYSFAGELSLGKLAAIISLAPLLLCGNTGPAHLAAALGTSVVDLYALTNPQHTPWQVPHRVLFHDVPCRFCYKSVCPQGHHDCLRQVSPDDVAAAGIALLRGEGGKRGNELSSIEVITDRLPA